MKNNDLREDLKKTYDYFGFEEQIRKFQEEVDELKIELWKHEMGIGDINNVIKEMADTMNVLLQFKEANEITDNELFNAQEEKNARTQKRIKEGYYK